MSTNNTPVQQQLSAFLQQNHLAVSQLKKHLTAEQHALRKNHRLELEKITEAKQSALTKVIATEKQLQQFFEQHNVPFSKQGINDFIQKAPKKQQSILKNQWSQLQQVMSETKRLNQVNGQVISRIAHGLNHIVNFINGQEPTQQVYQASGAPKRQNDSRLIAQA